MPTDVLNIPQDWMEITGVIVLDPVGWRSESRKWTDPVRLDEFLRLASSSTVSNIPRLIELTSGY